MELKIYYEGGNRDRHWVAPSGLGLAESRRQRIGRMYRTQEGARRRLVSALADPEGEVRAAAFDRALAGIHAAQARVRRGEGGASTAITEGKHRATCEDLLPQMDPERRGRYRATQR